MKNKLIIVAGGTGDLGHRIVRELRAINADVRVLVRPTSNAGTIKQLEAFGAKTVVLDLENVEEVSSACKGAECVISVLAGLEETIIGSQKSLLDGAIQAGVKRFIPSDYSLDFTTFQEGENRNLDIRRKFHTYLDTADIQATSIFNGAFMDMLTKEIPMILFDKNLIIHWGDKNQQMGFTTMDDTATFTAHAALDDSTPRYLHIAGDQISAAEIRKTMNELTGSEFRLLKTGSLGFLGFIIKISKLFDPANDDLYPAWQGMQYMKNMLDDRAQLTKTDNSRYPEMKFTDVRKLLKDYLENKNK